MDFEIKSFVGAGPIRFGMTQLEVRRLSLGPMRSFKRTPTAILPSDHFTDLGVVVSYKPPGVVEAIEFSRPSSPVFFGVRLFDETADQVKSLLASKDPNIEVDSDGFIAHSAGVGAYVLEADDEDDEPAQIVSVIAFEKGYYD